MRKTGSNVAGFEDGERGPKPRSVGSLKEPEEARKQIFPDALLTP